MTSVVRKFKILLLFEAVILLILPFGERLFANVQVAFLSSFLIILASGIAHKRMVQSRLKNESFSDDRDPLDKIDDPHELFEEEIINDAPAEELDLRSIVKEEKKKVKLFSANSLKYGLKGGMTLYRIGAYLFLFFGFVALKNNHLLDITIYLLSLPLGIVAGYMTLKE